MKYSRLFTAIDNELVIIKSKPGKAVSTGNNLFCHQVVDYPTHLFLVFFNRWLLQRITFLLFYRRLTVIIFLIIYNTWFINFLKQQFTICKRHQVVTCMQDNTIPSPAYPNSSCCNGYFSCIATIAYIK